jgi:outer membrane protein assembly factor BamB
MNRHCRVAFALVLLFAAGHVTIAQPPGPESANLRGDSAQTRKRLTEADQKLTSGQAADAVDALQRILDDAADDLISLDGKQYRPARWIAHQMFARLPADALKGYQDRIDDPARKLLDAGKKTRDVAPLWQLLDRYFVSRPADEGSLLLGDLLFEHGEFRTAEGVWRRLLPDARADVTYPNSKTDPAAVRARLILAAIFEGEIDRAKAELAAFKSKHAGAKGTFAGKDAPYADTLQAFLDAPPKLRPTANAGNDWPTFGGSPDRSARVGVRLPSTWMARPTWETPIPPLERYPDAPQTPPARPPVSHPVIVNGQVFVTDGYRVFGFDLATGVQTHSVFLANQPPLHEREKDKPVPPDACPSLTAAGDRLYVRVGSPLVRAPDAAKFGRAEETLIVCIGPTADDKRKMQKLWQLKPPVGEGKPPTAWEGAPLVAGRRLWAAYARFEGGRVIHGIACYDPADATVAPKNPAWAADICDSPPPSGSEGRPRQELLTLAGRNIVFCSNTGAVIAVDAMTGRRAWGFRYPRARKTNAHFLWDPSPAVACDGRVFVAPADGERVYALDPETGEMLWESGPTEGANIIGVADGKVIVAVSGPVRGIRGLGVGSGSSFAPDGWVQHNLGGELSYGRGFVTDDVIVWPTRSGLRFLRPQDGYPLPSQPHLVTPHTSQGKQPFGNVVYADGVLVVVTPTELWFYVSDQKQFEGLDKQSSRDPVRAKFEALVDKAESSLAIGEAKAAREPLLAAASGDFPQALRAWAAARLLLLAPRVDDETKLPADLRAVLSAELRAQWVLPPDGIPSTLGMLLDRHLGKQAAPRFLPISSAVNELAVDVTPALSPDADIDHMLRLPAGSSPLQRIPGIEATPKRFFISTSDGLMTVPFADGEKTYHDAVDHFTHAAEIAGGFIAAGPSAVAVYSADRAPTWVFRVPTTDALPARAGEFRMYSDEALPVAELSAFRLVGAWLIARLGERHLIALDLKGRRVAWVLGSNGMPGFRPVGFPDAPRFGSEFFASGRLIVAQISDGRRCFIRTETGKVLDIPGLDQSTAKVWWPLAPAEVESNRLAVSDGPGLVRMLNLGTGRVKWTHQLEGDVGLAGEPAQVRAWGSAMVLAIRRNHGIELDRLDMADGKSAWRSLGPAFLDAMRVNLGNADADADRLYVPGGNTLSAFALKDGKPAWEAELPDTRGAGDWVVKAGPKCIIVYPEAAIPREPVANVLARMVRSFRSNPEPRRLPALAAGLYDAWVVRSVPVLLLDPETGKQLAKFDIPANGPAVTAWFERDLAVVATGDRVCWLK